MPKNKRARRLRRGPRLPVEVLEPRSLLSGAPAIDLLETPYGNVLPASVSFLGDRVFVSNYISQLNEQWLETPGVNGQLYRVSTGLTFSGPGISDQIEFGGRLFFAANTPTGGGSYRATLYAYDSTQPSPTFIRSFGNSGSQVPNSFFQLNGKLAFFWVPHPNDPAQLWTSDGTTAGTTLVWTAPADFGYLAGPIQVVNGNVFFASSTSLWRSDGTNAGTVRIYKNAANGADKFDFVSTIVTAGSRLFLTRYSNAGMRLYAANLDGTGMTQVQVPSSNGAESFLLNSDLTPVGSGGDRVMYFATDPQTNVTHPFVTDGTLAGTTDLFGLLPNASAAGNLVYAGGAAGQGRAAFYQNSSGPGQSGIWVTDGTPQGTQQAVNRALGLIEGFAFDGRAYFREQTNVGVRVYQTDGTVAGTTPVQYFTPLTSYAEAGSGFVTTHDGRIIVRGTINHRIAIWSLDTGLPAATVEGQYFLDANRNGTREGFERALSATPYLDLDNNGQFDANVDLTPIVTTPDGRYTFDGLLPGTYSLKIKLTNGDAALSVSKPQGGSFPLTLQALDHVAGQDFAAAGTSTLVWGTVFDDTDGDGARDTGEGAPAAPQRMYLDLNNDGKYDAPAEPSTLTAADGTFAITPSAAGTYVVRRDDQTGWRQTTPASRGGVTVTVATGGVSDAGAFGVAQAAAAGFAGRAWDDQDFDGVQDDGEPGLAGVTVQLFDRYNRQVGTAVVTGADGAYAFPNQLVDVGYTLNFTRPAGKSWTATDQGGDDAKDSDLDQQAERTPVLTLGPGETKQFDVGVIPRTSLTGAVYRDANENAVRDPGEAGVTGFTVYLDRNGNDAFDPDETRTAVGGDGSYSFFVSPGAQQVGVIAPAGWSVPGSVSVRTFPVAAGQQFAAGDVAAVAGGATVQATARGPEFRVNATTAGSQQQPSIGLDASGTLVAVWYAPAAGGAAAQVMGRCIDSDGLPLGGDFIISTTATAPTGSPRVVVEPDGDFVVAWLGASGTVYARRYAAADIPLGGPFMVAASAARGNLQMALDPTGGFALAWPASAPADSNGVLARRYDAAAKPKGAEFLVNDVTTGNQTAAGLTFDPTGLLTVAYSSDGQDGSGSGVYGRRFAAADGAPLGPAFLVNVTTAGAQVAVGVASDSAGRSAFLWVQAGDVYARTFDADGTPRAGESRIDSSSANALVPGVEGSPQIVALSSGAFLATWVSAGQDGSGSGVYGQLLTRDGVPQGREFRVNTTTADAQQWPAVATGANGAFTAAWSSNLQDGSLEGIYAQRFEAYSARSSVSGVVWTDVDGDGTRGPTETPIAAVGVELRDTVGRTVDSTVTLADGTYRFTLLRPGDTYRVKFSIPSNLLGSPTDQGGDDTRDSDADAATGLTAPFLAPPAGATLGSVDAGAMVPATVAGTLYYDADGDNARGAGEPPLSDWTVFLDDDGDGQFDPNERRTTSSATGAYSFGSLRAGTYRVSAVPAWRWMLSGPPSARQTVLTPGQNAAVDIAARPSAATTDVPAPAGGEFRVNTTTTGDQLAPAAAGDALGNTLIVWSDPTGIYAQRYAAGGSVSGAEFQVAAAGATAPAVSMADDGRFVVTWSASGDIFARRYTAAGTAAGAAFPVNTTTAGILQTPDVAVDDSGKFVIVWSGADQDGTAAVFGQRYAADGTPLGVEFRATGTASGNQSAPKVAADAAGDFVVAYLSDHAGAGNRVYARRFASGGTGGSEFLVNSAPLGQTYDAVDVSMNAGGEFVVVYRGYDASGYGVEARRYDPQGVAQGTATVVVANVTSTQDAPSVRVADDGRFVVAWQTVGDGGVATNVGVRAQWFDGSGVRLGGELAVNTTTALNQNDPDVALLPGGFLVAWASDAQDGSGVGVYGRRYQAPAGTGGLRVVSSAFDVAGEQIRITFAGDATPQALAASSVSVTPTGGGAAVTFAPSGYDAATRTAAYAAAGGSLLPDGDYHAVFVAGGAAGGSAGSSVVAAPATLDFFVLAGDIDRNRTVGPSDFNLLATHFGRSGQTWAEGDLDGDGTVGPSDFNLLATHFGVTLAAPASPQPAASAVLAVPSQPVHGTRATTTTTKTAAMTKRPAQVAWSTSPITSRNSGTAAARAKARR